MRVTRICLHKCRGHRGCRPAVSRSRIPYPESPRPVLPACSCLRPPGRRLHVAADAESVGRPSEGNTSMSSRLSMYRRSALALTAALATLTVLSGTAAAAPNDLDAAHTRAAAKVAADGTLLAKKNVDGSYRARQGAYCVKISDPDIDLTNTVITATVTNIYARMISATGEPTSDCGYAASTITIHTFYEDAVLHDAPFTVAVL